MEMSVRLILAVVCLHAVLLQYRGGAGLTDELSVCAVALNQSINSSNSSNSSDYYSTLSLHLLSKSMCRGDDYYADCMGYQSTVSIESEPLSHTGASSLIRVAINPNATAGQEEFYYTFCVSYNGSTTQELVACASNDGQELEIEHTWEKNGVARMRVGVFPKSYRREPFGCNSTTTIVAGNFGFKIGMKLYNDDHTFSETPPPPSSSSFPSSIPSRITNSTNNTYVTGNLTFEPQPDIWGGSSGSSRDQVYQYFYLYDYGDNSSSDDVSEFNSTHLFERPGNYSYAVEGFAVDSNDHSRAYYGLHKGMVVILDPVSNVSVRFNNNNSIAADTKVYLHICANGSFPISVCWTVQPVNGSNSSYPVASSQCPSPSNNIATCHSIYQEYPCPSYEMTFHDKGHFDMIATFTNKVSCVRVVYTFHVVAAEKPPIVATTTSVGVVVVIALAVVVVLIILAVGGYLPYRRYRNHMIETADFKFIDLSENKVSAWSRIKQEILRVVRSRRNADKIGLVNLIDEPHGASGNSSTNSTSSSSSLGSYNNYNTV